MSRVMGIDPGLASLGWALLDVHDEDQAVTLLEYGTFTTPPRTNEGERLRAIDTWLSTFVSIRRPHAVAIERPYPTARMLTNILTVGMAYGVIALALRQAGVLDITEHNSAAVKGAVGLARGAKKKDMRAAVSLALGVPRLKGADDGLDAVAVALCRVKRDAVDQAQLFRVRA